MSDLWILVYLNLFCAGFVNIGFCQGKNLLVLLMSIELMLFGAGFGFINYSILLSDFAGQVYALLLLLMSAGESAMGLGLIVASYRAKGNIDITSFNSLKN